MNVNGKFDNADHPHRAGPFWCFIEWTASAALLIAGRHRLVKHDCQGLKGPYLLLSTHASFVDFCIAVRVAFPRGIHWVASIEEFNGREALFRQVGVLAKRKFTNDIVLVRHILYSLRHDKAVLALYPEARFSLAGINEQLDKSLGKMAKAAHVPVVVLACHGDFVHSPQWRKHPYSHIPLVTDMYQVATKEEVETLPAEEIQRRIEEKFVIDDYAWIRDHKIKDKNKQKANNMHVILYQCPHCGKEHMMNSKGTKIWCENCGKEYELDIYDQLHCTNGETIFHHIPDWYSWERANVRAEIREGRYKFEDDVYVEELASSKAGFDRQGICHMTQDDNGILVKGELHGKPFELHKPVHSMYSMHIEYDYKGRGDAIDLATTDDTWFVYPVHAKNSLTKLHFATEELFKYHQEVGDKK